MGCTYDIFNATINKKEYQEDFVRLWNEVLKDDLYDTWVVADMENFKKSAADEYDFGIDGGPLFNTIEYGGQIVGFLVEFLKLHPDVVFDATYECTFSNCGDMVFSMYKYENKTLKVITKCSEFPYVSECKSCGYEFEDEISLSDLYECDSLTCPECGKTIKIPYGEEIKEIKIK